MAGGRRGASKGVRKAVADARATAVELLSGNMHRMRGVTHTLHRLDGAEAGPPEQEAAEQLEEALWEHFEDNSAQKHLANARSVYAMLQTPTRSARAPLNAAVARRDFPLAVESWQAATEVDVEEHAEDGDDEEMEEEEAATDAACGDGSDEVCPRCKRGDMVRSKSVQMRSADEPADRLNWCVRASCRSFPSWKTRL